jgi:uncharacterized protein YcnI
MREHHGNLIRVAVGLLVVIAWAPASAGAHAIVQPSASRPADLQRYTLTVPNERNAPTNYVRLEVPDGIDFFLVESKPGWRTTVDKRNGRVVAVVFDGGLIRPDYYETFRFIAKNPVVEGTIAWNVQQRYRNGEVVDWTGPPGSDTPASRTRIAESAIPVDTVDVQNGSQTSPTVTANASGATGHDELALVLSITALILAAGGVAVTVLRGRPLV